MGESVRVGGGREREYDDGGEKVGGGRGKERGGMGVCKRDKLGDGRECERVGDGRGERE